MLDLAIITARAGSVGLPGKNVAELGGVPLIAWTVRAAMASRCFRRVIVSTDGPAIMSAARAAGAEVPFVRPAELATSAARSSDVVLHALSATKTTGAFALLQPTSPFRSAEHIRQAVRIYDGTPSPAVVSVGKGKPAAWQFTTDETGRLQPLARAVPAVSRRQDAEPLLAPNGALYLCDAKTFRDQGTLFPDGVAGYLMGHIDSLDIDEEEDLALARAIVDARLRVIDS